MALIGFEALLRWQHPERGLIPPDEFIPLAEETGMMAAIGAFVLEQSLRQLAAWRRSQPELTVSINLTYRQLIDAGLFALLAARDADDGASRPTPCGSRSPSGR